MHCDDVIDDETAHPALRAYLAWARQPAIAKDWKAQPKLFATYQGADPLAKDCIGKRCRVVMASRFGDVGIRFSDFSRDSGYSIRCMVLDLSDFSTAP